MNKEKDQNSYHKINLNWFPGHMAKTRRQITEDLKMIDVVIELLDARIPISSQNPEIRQIIGNNKKVIVLNKSDLADESDNKKWVSKFQQEGNTVVLTDSNSGRGTQEVVRQVQKIMEEELNRYAEKGRKGRKIRTMIVGIPNVGKSSFINRIANKNSAKIGNKPGVTKDKQWIRVNENIELLDTPGVLWPKFESEKVALNLAFTGTIKEEILDSVEIAYQLTKFLLNNYRENIIERYSLDSNMIDEILKQEQDENENISETRSAAAGGRAALCADRLR